MKINRLRYIFPFLTAVTALFITMGLNSCRDDILMSPEGNEGNERAPWEDKDLVCLPLGVMIDGGGISTRATGDTIGGANPEQQIDTTLNECFAIFFDEKKKVKYIKDLYFSSQLAEAYPETSQGSEKTLYMVAYVPRTDVIAEDNKDSDGLLKNVLVILNGGGIFNTVADKVAELIMAHHYNPNYNLDDRELIMKLTWDISQGDVHERMGFNSRGYFTMSNAAYVENGVVKTVTELKVSDNNYYTSLNDFIKDSRPLEQKVSATIYLERMVAKISAPEFNTDILGEADRVFRPDQNASKLIVYHWEGDSLKSEMKNWRIHLLGWTVNGEETRNYIFKNISTNYPGWTGWNNPTERRSNWSEDPHYTSANNDFYPWQFRKASDRSDVISVEGSWNSNTTKDPALRYYSFNEVAWPDSLYLHENTYNPFGDWYSDTDSQGNLNPYYLDGRASILAGPHLIMTGELYLEGADGSNPGGSKYNNFGTVAHLYSDRIRRYFLSEVDWFKMFLRDFNHALKNQEEMHFPVYDWDNQSSGKANHSYTAKPTGECKLYYDGLPLTFERVDSIFAKGTSLSTPANVRNGDGRLIPWIESKNAKGETVYLRVRTEDGKELQYDCNNPDDTPGWTYDMYMSLFYDWFGPIDHYYNGYMYYAGEIKHHNDLNPDYQYFGVVRNHWYKFNVQSINSLGVPVDNPYQPIIPGKYAYRDQVLVWLRILDYHRHYGDFDLSN